MLCHFKIAHEIDMICHIDKMISLFEDNWKSYVGTILKHSQSFQSKDVKLALEPLSTDDTSSTKDNGM